MCGIVGFVGSVAGDPVASLSVDKDIEKGETQTVTFTPKQSGKVEFFCKYHKATKNMVGSLSVS